MLTPYQRIVIKVLDVVLGYIRWQYMGKRDVVGNESNPKAEYCDELSNEITDILVPD